MQKKKQKQKAIQACIFSMALYNIVNSPIKLIDLFYLLKTFYTWLMLF